MNRTLEGEIGNHIMHLDFKWIPLPEQSNTHFVCFEAIDQPAPEADILSSGQHCVELLVNGVNPAPGVFFFSVCARMGVFMPVVMGSGWDGGRWGLGGGCRER